LKQFYSDYGRTGYHTSSPVSDCQLLGGTWYICLPGRSCVRMRLG